MKINAFFTHRLQAPLYNHVWSWGAVDERSKRVFLRTNERHIFTDDDADWALVYNPDWDRSAGHSERLRHIDAIKGGYKGFAVTYSMNDHGKIDDYDDETLLELGAVIEEDGLTYAKIEAEVPIDSLFVARAARPLADDIAETFASRRLGVDRQALINTRIGQGTFRTIVLRLWDYQCAVTGVSTLATIRASHIKPWSKSSKTERLDPYNGLPLVATLDALFDEGLITFNDRGLMLVSPQMPIDDAKVLGLANQRLRHRPHKRSKGFLQYHRDQVFLK